VSKEEMLPPDSATWRGILQLERYSPVSRSPFQLSAVPAKRISFVFPRIAPHLAVGVLLVAAIAGAGLLAWETLSAPAQKTATMLPRFQTMATHLSVRPDLNRNFTVPPPPLPDTAIIVPNAAVEMETAVVAKNVTQPAKQPVSIAPKPTPPIHSVAVKYPGALDAAGARVNEGAEANNKPSIQVRKVNQKEVVPLTIKEEVIHE